MGVAASLPWSTSATSILIVLWLICVLATLDLVAIRAEISTPAGGLPVLIWVLAAAGTAWAEIPWADRFAGLESFHKLLLIPLLFAQFRRSENGPWVLIAFVGSCVILLATSYYLALWPGLTWRGVRSGPGVPVRDYIAQNGEFLICVFVLLPVALSRLRARPWVGAGMLALAALFVVNLLYIATARTALAVTIVLLLIFSFRQFGWKKGALFLVTAAVITLAVWQSSAFLRWRVGTLPQEIGRYWNENATTSAGERLEFWKRSVSFVANAPVLGHGTGTIREMFRRSAVGDAGPASMVAANPHNQTLAVAIQLGFVGVLALYAMWISHFLLFRGPGMAAWIGLVIVVQNVVSSVFNSHLFDFVQGWIYVFGVGVAGGIVLQQRPTTQAGYRSPGESCHRDA
jgi:O-antigen ligase